VIFDAKGTKIVTEEIIHPNAGGVYGWWGTYFTFSPDGSMLAYSRPDGFGMVDLSEKELVPLIDILPYQTGSSWAWATGLGWSANQQAIYFTDHAVKAGLENPEASPIFDLAAVPVSLADFDGQAAVTAGPVITLFQHVGMFSYPVPSPLWDEGGFKVAYLSAIFPDQSENSRYRLMMVDRDGSNQQVIFPPQDNQGIEPQRVVWSPVKFFDGNFWIAVKYQDNLWLIDPISGDHKQITGDGLISRIDWK
jgi:resuscitation-promoting factor RpfB